MTPVVSQNCHAEVTVYDDHCASVNWSADSELPALDHDEICEPIAMRAIGAELPGHA